jgi:hypothetical protein
LLNLPESTRRDAAWMRDLAGALQDNDWYLDHAFVESTEPPQPRFIARVMANNHCEIGIPGCLVHRLRGVSWPLADRCGHLVDGGLCVESMIGPSSTIQYLCVGDDHLRFGLKVRDGQGHLTIRDGLWAYCSAGRKDEPHEWEAIPATPFPQIRHASIMRRSGRGRDRPQDEQEERSK